MESKHWARILEVGPISNKVWVDTVTDLNQYKASAEELEARKLARKSNNKLLAKVEFFSTEIGV